MGGFNIIVEAKAGLFDDSLMAIGDPEIFRHKTRALAKAVRQGWSAPVAFRKPSSLADLRNGTEDYLFVVTNKPVNVGSGADPQSIYPKGELEYPTEEARTLLPLERIYFVSVDELERLIASAGDVVFFHEFLRETVRLDANPATGKTFFGDHLPTFPDLEESSFLTNALQDAHNRIEQVLSARI
jgi:hypothetical protein